MRKHTVSSQLLLFALLASALASSLNSGQSSSTITFVNSRQPVRRPGSRPQSGGSRHPPNSSIQFGMTSTTSEQQSTGNTQTNRGQASGVSFQQQSGLGGATQTTNNQAVIESLQQAAGGGGGGGQQSSNNVVNIESTQVQQNVQGVLVNVHEGNTGIVIVNTQDEKGDLVEQKLVNNKPVVAPTSDSSGCKRACRRSTGQLYCCDDGSNRQGPVAIHGGSCPEARLVCPQGSFFRNCAHDGQCAISDKCCYDACANRHVCKLPDTNVRRRRLVFRN